ncbi:MAG: putative DNA binding domain-containing protein [Ignavibacteriae bacterium]|nr:putative DNA binding domain-containing protein [Ignavibacteriota bacterium]
MEPIELLDIIAKGESSTVQFKERISDAYKIATEMVAFSNSKGGLIIVGVNDKSGELKGLGFQEIQNANNLLASAASDNVKSPITIISEQVTINGHNLIIVRLKEGSDKPYRDNKGIVWMKNGSDKRKVVSNDELLRMLQSSGNIAADEEPVANTTIDDIDVDFVHRFIKKKTKKTLRGLKQTLSQILNNMGFAKNDNLTLAGLLLFGKRPQSFKPLFSVQCIAFVGNYISGLEYRDSEPPFEGNLSELFEKTMSFMMRNLRKDQVKESFNSLGELEIPKQALEELVVNALIHRDYFIQSSIKVFIFDNRIEIISPGKLPNNLTIEKIKSYTSIARNQLLFSNARYLLPYIGIGSGIPRALESYPDINFVNDIDKELFIAVIQRK